MNELQSFSARLSSTRISRRNLLVFLGASAAMSVTTACAAKPPVAGNFPVRHTDAEWRKLLTPDQYHILREQGTERSFTSALLNEHRAGTFLCAADDNPLFSSRTKFESGTGWPSFWQPLKGAVATSTDTAFGTTRTEVHCARCGGHLGHVFQDGPPPTGLRYCMNGAVLKFRPGVPT